MNGHAFLAGTELRTTALEKTFSRKHKKNNSDENRGFRLSNSPSETFSLDERPGLNYVPVINDLTLGKLPPLANRLKEAQVFKLCDEWQARYLILTASELIISVTDSEDISDKIPLV